jgi:hypothetical protein
LSTISILNSHCLVAMYGFNGSVSFDGGKEGSVEGYSFIVVYNDDGSLLISLFYYSFPLFTFELLFYY